MLYSLKEITIVPTKISDIDSRSECNPYYEEVLPLFTAPMSAVVGVKSCNDYLKNKINPIIPRNVSLNDRLYYLHEYNIFVAFSLQEIEDNLLNKHFKTTNGRPFKILIDIANGNMKKMFDLVKRLKKKYNENVVIMAGNIANPYTYEEYCKIGIDYCRVGIGGGAGCLTTTMTGIHYPLGSLLMECNYIKQKYDNPTKIVADGGIKGYSDIIKCLALGADYVMCGSVFTKMMESEGDFIFKHETNPYLVEEMTREKTLNRFKEPKNYKIIFKNFYGMSTPKAQIELGGDGSKATEGNETRLVVEYDMSSWVNNFKSYLKSTMSYCGKRTLDEFIGKVSIEIMSDSSINSVNK